MNDSNISFITLKCEKEIGWTRGISDVITLIADFEI